MFSLCSSVDDDRDDNGQYQWCISDSIGDLCTHFGVQTKVIRKVKADVVKLK